MPTSEPPEPVFCTACGAPIATASRFCGSCGTAQETESADVETATPETLKSELGREDVAIGPNDSESAASGEEPEAAAPVIAATPATPPVRPVARPGLADAPASQAPSVATPLPGGLPIELWIVIGAFAIPGGWVLIHALNALPDALKLIGSSFLGFRIGLAFALLIALVGAMGAGMLWIAWRLYRLDRIARGLAFVVAGTIVASVLFAGDGGGGNTAALLGSLVGAAILQFSPAVKVLFTGDLAGQSAVPTSVIVSRVTLTVCGLFALVVAVTYFLLATFEGRYWIVGVLIVAACVAGHLYSARLMSADRAARQNISVGITGVVLLVLILGKFSTGLFLPVGLGVGAVACLWLPNDARRFFGDPPLDYGAGSG